MAKFARLKMAISPGSNNKGSIDYARSPRWWHWNHPRIRGVHGFFPQVPIQTSGSSPHTRGPLRSKRLHFRRHGIIPAYAGSTYVAWPFHWPQQDHPRIRGVHASMRFMSLSISGSSPHTRGPLHRVEPCSVVGRIIPAYAGSTQRQRTSNHLP